MLDAKRRKEIEHRIGYTFHNPALLEKALTHSSYSNEHRLGKLNNNERLEFLGDAVLEVVSSEFLYKKYPERPEGELTKQRASMVCEQTLALCARDLELGSYLLLGRGEDMTGGRERASVTSDAMEAMIGAIYLDGGFANAKEYIDRFILNDIENKQLFFDSKTILQEIVQGEMECEPVYELTGEEVEPAECSAVLSRRSFDAAFSKYVEWHAPDPSACTLRQLCLDPSCSQNS